MIEIYFEEKVQARFNLYLEKNTFESQIKTKLNCDQFYQYQNDVMMQDQSNLKEMKNDERLFKLE